MGLDKDTRHCQNIETYDDCKTRIYIEHMRKECGCLPLSLRLSREVKPIIYFQLSSLSPKSKAKRPSNPKLVHTMETGVQIPVRINPCPPRLVLSKSCYYPSSCQDHPLILAHPNPVLNYTLIENKIPVLSLDINLDF